MYNTVVSKSLLTRVFLILIFLSALASVTSAQIATGAVGSQIADDVATADLVPVAVTTSKIPTGAGTATQIADSAGTTSKLRDSAVTSNKIAAPLSFTGLGISEGTGNTAPHKKYRFFGRVFIDGAFLWD